MNQSPKPNPACGCAYCDRSCFAKPPPSVLKNRRGSQRQAQETLAEIRRILGGRA